MSVYNKNRKLLHDSNNRGKIVKMSSDKNDHLKDQLSDRYMEFLQARDLVDNLWQLRNLVYSDPIDSVEQMIRELISSLDSAGIRDDGFRETLEL